MKTKPVKGYEGIYSITANGRIYSEPRMVRRGKTEVFLEGSWCKVRKPGKDGYRRFRSSVDGDHVDFLVHRMVAEAWIPNPKKLPQINHKDCNKLNNHYSNLEWCDGKHNIAHGVKNALFPYGINSYNAKLTEKQVRQIRGMFKLGITHSVIGGIFGINPVTVGHIKAGRSWRRLK